MIRRLGQGPIENDVRALRVLLGRAGLAQPTGYLPFAAYDVLPGSGISANGYPFSVTLSRDITVKRWVQAAYIATTNNGSNYWTISLRRMDTLASLFSFDTSAQSPGAWFREFSENMDLAVLSSYKALLIRVEKTGSPGAIYLPAPAVTVI